MRIVSLIPSATEIVFALGLGDALVGVSHECDFPSDAKKLPVLCRPKRLKPEARGAVIHREVLDIIREGLSLYTVDTEQLEALSPDLILTQDQCHVCAVSLADVQNAIGSLTRKETQVVSLSPHSLEEILGDIGRVGELLGVPERGRDLVSSLRKRLAALKDLTGPSRPRVLSMEWLEPPMVGGGWIPELVRLAGGEPLIVSTPERFKQVDWSEVTASRPEILCLYPCGYPVEKSLRELEDSPARAPLLEMDCTQSGRTFVLDGNAYFNRSGPRIVDSAEILAGLFHPEQNRFREKYAEAYRRWPLP